MAFRPIESSELLPLAEYRARRSELVASVIRLKEARRLEVGPWVSVLFENRRTVLHQIQEMLEIEGLAKPREIAHEIETYSELLPRPGEASATLFIEIDEPRTRADALKRLAGIESTITLKAGGRSTTAQDKRPIDPAFARPLASAVYYLRFPLTEPLRAALASGPSDAWLEIGHPEYRHAAALSPALARALAADAS